MPVPMDFVAAAAANEVSVRRIYPPNASTLSTGRSRRERSEREAALACSGESGTWAGRSRRERSEREAVEDAALSKRAVICRSRRERSEREAGVREIRVGDEDSKFAFSARRLC